MARGGIEKQVNTFRSFNRFYTRQIGLLNQGLLKTSFSLTQARILFELAHRQETTATELITELNIDPGYLSRIVSAFEKEQLVRRVRSKTDSRRRLLKLSAKGKKTFFVLNNRSNKEAKDLLQSLPGEDRERLLHAMQVIQNILQTKKKKLSPYLLRSHLPGDIGWITHRHGVLYAQEYGFDETFEALVAEILVRFIKQHDPERERIWMAEQDGERIGSVMIVDAGEKVAQLRLLLLEPKARGRGIGKRLVEECIHFSKLKGYRKLRLWTQSNLDEARRLYVHTGFKLVEEKPHKSFGQDLVAEVWELSL